MRMKSALHGIALLTVFFILIASANAQSATTTSVSLTSGANPSVYGDTLAFTATVNSSVPNGETITFYSNGQAIGTGTTLAASATLITSALLAGSDSITAKYAGDTNYTTSTSAPITQTVNNKQILSVISNVINDPDGGSYTWALDNFTRTITAWQTGPNSYLVNLTDVGKSYTFAGAKSPNDGTILEPSNGTVDMHGSQEITFNGNFSPHNSTTGFIGTFNDTGTRALILNGSYGNTPSTISHYLDMYFTNITNKQWNGWQYVYAYGNQIMTSGTAVINPSNTTGNIVVNPALIVNVTTQIVNNPDSGDHGYWALDNFTRQIKIYQTGLHSFMMNFTDSGLSYTFAGVQSPGILNVVEPYNGVVQMTGSASTIFNGTFSPGSNSVTGTLPTLNNNGKFTGTSIDTSNTVSTYQYYIGTYFINFDSANYSGSANNGGGWTYTNSTYPSNGNKWVDSNTNNWGTDASAGDIVAVNTQKPIVNVTTQIVNDPDGGSYTWALDNLTRTITVWQTGLHSFLINFTDTGKSHTFAGALSPNSNTIREPSNGTVDMRGSQEITLNGTFSPQANTIGSIGTFDDGGTYALILNGSYGSTPSTITHYLAMYFTNITNKQWNGWQYTYTYGNQTMVSGSAIINSNNTTGNIVVNPALILYVTAKIANDPDSGNNGYWALDNFTRTIKVYQTGLHSFKASYKDSGYSYTFAGAKSPLNGVAQPADGIMTMKGYENITFNGAFSPGTNTVSTSGAPIGTLDLKGTPANVINSTYYNTHPPLSTTDYYLNSYFPGFTNRSIPTWSWSYVLLGTTNTAMDSYTFGGFGGNDIVTSASSAPTSSGNVNATKSNFDMPSTTTGQASLPTGHNSITLSNNTVLDLANSVQTASSGNVIVGGNTISLSTGFKIGSSTVNLTKPQTVGGQTVKVDKAVMLTSGQNGASIVINNTALSKVSVAIPNGTTVLAPSNWTGTITPPKKANVSGSAPSGFSVGNTVIEVGSPNVVLLFNKPATILLPGVNGTVGYKPAGSDSWVQITSKCGGTYAAPSDPEFPGECYISNGTDTKIVTYHFTTFGSLNVNAAPSGGTSGSGGSGSSGNTPLPGGAGSSVPVVSQVSNSCYDISNFAQLNTASMVINGRPFSVVENFITPTSAGVSVNGASYTLDSGQTVTISSDSTGTATVQLKSIQYVPIQNTVDVGVCFTLPATTATTSSSTTVTTTIPANATAIAAVPPNETVNATATQPATQAPAVPAAAVAAGVAIAIGIAIGLIYPRMIQQRRKR
ncbi:MAG: Ig-like domain repeat protein [Candidatus Micrarchaeota archaeon]|nr:Ig-like domain repeat protein [Candidatus Micrarchaeota archaeon]